MQLKGNVFLKIKRRSMNNMITPKEIEQKTMSPETVSYTHLKLPPASYLWEGYRK